MISLHYTSHTKAYNTIYTACNIVEAIYSFTTQDHKFWPQKSSVITLWYCENSIFTSRAVSMWSTNVTSKQMGRWMGIIAIAIAASYETW